MLFAAFSAIDGSSEGLRAAFPYQSVFLLMLRFLSHSTNVAGPAYRSAVHHGFRHRQI